MFLAGACDGRTGHAADEGADRRSLASTGDAADERAEPDASADLSRRFLAFAFALGLDIRRGDFIDAPPERDRVRLQGDLVASLHLPGLLYLDGLQDDPGTPGNDHSTCDHDWIVDERLELHASLGSVDVN